VRRTQSRKIESGANFDEDEKKSIRTPQGRSISTLKKKTNLFLFSLTSKPVSSSLLFPIFLSRFTDLPKKARGNGTGLEELTVLRSMAVGKKLAGEAAASSSGDGGGGGESADEEQLDEAELLFRASRDAGERVSWIGKYLAALEAFEVFLRAQGILDPRPPTPRVPLPGGGVLSIVADAILAQDDVGRKLVFEWSSALLGGSGGGGGFAKLFGLSAEKAAATALLAAALRNAGAAAAAAAASSASKKGGISEDGGAGAGAGAGDESSGSALVNAASLFRRAAGLYDAIAAAGDAALASSASSLPPLAELRPSCARALSCLCLADAQALAAAKAKSPSVRGSAWAGAAQLYHRFGKELADDASAASAGAAGGEGGGNGVGAGSAAVPPPPLAAASAAAAALAVARARAAAAEAAFEGGESTAAVPDPGIAMAHLREGLAALQAGKKAAERVDDERRKRKSNGNGNGNSSCPSSLSWVSAFEQEARIFSEASGKLDRERLMVYMTTVPSQAPAGPTARVVVAASAVTAPVATAGLF